MLRLFGIFCILIVLGCGMREAADSLPVALPLTLEAEDGLKLSATLYPAAVPASPAIILLHAYAGDRSSWGGIALRLQEAGYGVISFDMRGHGESVGTGENSLNFKVFGAAEWEAAESDVAVAKAALIKAGADPMRIAVMGESIGANLAMRYAVADREIAALVLVSPGLDYKGVTCGGLVPRLKERPLLLLATEQDAYSASSARTLHAEAPGFSELRLYTGSAHGTEIFADTPVAVQDLLLWLEQNFAKAKAPGN